MTGMFPALRVMSLIRTYDLIPNHHELVDLVFKPLIEAEVSAHFSQCAYHDQMLVHRFAQMLNQLWYEAQSRRELLNVTDLRVEFPEATSLVSLRIGWVTLREPDVRRTLEINTSRRRWYELDEAYLKAQLPLDRITKFVKSDDAN